MCCNADVRSKVYMKKSFLFRLSELEFKLQIQSFCRSKKFKKLLVGVENDIVLIRLNSINKKNASITIVTKRIKLLTTRVFNQLKKFIDTNLSIDTEIEIVEFDTFRNDNNRLYHLIKRK